MIAVQDYPKQIGIGQFFANGEADHEIRASDFTSQLRGAKPSLARANVCCRPAGLNYE
jgi:hypothetical protein